MNKHEFKQLLEAITETWRFDPNDPHNYGMNPSMLKPWEFASHGDIHDLPGGKEAWEKQQATKAAAKASAEAEVAAKKARTLPLPTTPLTDKWHQHIESNGFGLSPEAHAKAKELVSKLNVGSAYDLPARMYDIRHHLIKSGVDENHPHLHAITREAEDEESYNRERSKD